jgi:imidazolonepropionase-like amidohydrolase
MDTLFTARLLVDGISPHAREDAALLVRDGRIAAIGGEATRAAAKTARRVDLSPGVLAPGLIDCHVHLALSSQPQALFATINDSLSRVALRAAGNMQTAIRAGITTLRDCGGPAEPILALARGVREGLITGPRILASGAPVTTTGGHCWMFGLEADGIVGVQEAVRRMCREGADFIKVMVTGGGSTPGSNFLRSQYSMEELTELAADAHRLGRKVTGHAHGREGIRRAVEAGFDGIEHCSMLRDSWVDMVYDKRLGKEMAARGTVVCRTQTGGERPRLEEINERHPQWPMFSIARSLVSDGVTLIAGTDAGIDGTGFDGLPAAIEALVGLAGMSPHQALAAGTSEAAKALGIAGETGALEVGRCADIIVLDVDPLADIRALRAIRAVYRNGVEIRDETALRP